MAQAVGLVPRYPLLDQDLVAICAAIPGPIKVQRRRLRFRTKWPLRYAMSGRLPPRLVDRPQRGLPQPLDHWLRTEGSRFLRDRIEALLENPDRLFVDATVRRWMRQWTS